MEELRPGDSTQENPLWFSGPMWLDQILMDKIRAHLKVTNLKTSAKSLLLYKVTYL